VPFIVHIRFIGQYRDNCGKDLVLIEGFTRKSDEIEKIVRIKLKRIIELFLDSSMFIKRF